MSGTITQLAHDRGTGSLVGENGKTYLFRRRSLSNCWFHELSVGAAVTFEESGERLEANAVRLVR